MSGIRIGEVTHFYDRLCVAVLKLTEPIRVGDMLHLLGHHTDYQQKVESLQIEHQAVTEAGPGVAVAVRAPAGAVSGRLAPVAALVPDLARWEPAERRGLLALLRAKEGPRERPFALGMLRHARWRDWLLAAFPTRAG